MGITKIELRPSEILLKSLLGDKSLVLRDTVMETLDNYSLKTKNKNKNKEKKIAVTSKFKTWASAVNRNDPTRSANKQAATEAKCQRQAPQMIYAQLVLLFANVSKVASEWLRCHVLAARRLLYVTTADC